MLFALLAVRATRFVRFAEAQDGQQIQMQLGSEVMGNWQMTGLVNDMRLDLFYDEISKTAKAGKSSDQVQKPQRHRHTVRSRSLGVSAVH